MFFSRNSNESFAARRDFDFIPRRPEVAVAPAVPNDIGDLARMARALIPDITATGTQLSHAASRDPDSILTFKTRGRLVGGIAFLFLNRIGLELLLRGRLDFSAPSIEVLADPTDDVTGIYTWATAVNGRGILALGNVAEHLSKRRFRHADMYARPNTADGRRLVQSVGYRRLPAHENLWIYERALTRFSILPSEKSRLGAAHA